MQLSRMLWAAGAASFLSTSCGVFGASSTASARTAASSSGNVAPLKVVFEMDPRSHSCSALHVLVREVKRTDYPRVEYDEVARLLNEGADDKTLEWLVLVPGEKCVATIRRPAGSDIALFFMFPTPSDDWKRLITADENGRVQLAILDKRACATSTHSGSSGRRNVVNVTNVEPKPCRSYAE